MGAGCRTGPAVAGGRWDAGPGPAGWSGCLSGLRGEGLGRGGRVGWQEARYMEMTRSRDPC